MYFLEFDYVLLIPIFRFLQLLTKSLVLQVGLALVVDGKIVLGVMGCPNWKNNSSDEAGMIMVAHVGCGTWKKHLASALNSTANVPSSWTRCFVDHYSILLKARFCIQDSQTWEFLPLFSSYSATTNANDVGDNQILLLPTCCGRLTVYCLNTMSFTAYM